MSDRDKSGRNSLPRDDQVVYEMRNGMIDDDYDISLVDLWYTLWYRKWIVLAIISVFFIGSAIYALTATKWYRAEALLAPAEELSVPSIGEQLGGLAMLAGMSVGGGDSAEALATLESRDFARSFIEDHELLPVFFVDDWNAEKQHWKSDDPDEWPDIRDGIRYFHKEILKVNKNRATGYVTLAVEWPDSDLAVEWADELIRRVNDGLRSRALSDAQENIAYLEEQLAKTNVIAMQQSIGRLLETELQKLMLARGNEEFSFRTIDHAAVPKKPERPNKALIVILGTLLGSMISVLLALIRGLPQTDASVE